MKLNKYSWLAVLSIVFASCQEDTLVNQSQEQGVYTLNCVIEGRDSRAQIMLGNSVGNVEYFQWNEGDSLNVIQQASETGSLTEHAFEITDYSDVNPMRTANFTTTNALTSGNKFMALYPNVGIKEQTVDMVRVRLDNTITDYSDESWTEYFNKNMFMYALGTVGEANAETTADFKHLCSMFRITYTNLTEEAKTLSKVLTDAPYCYEKEFKLFYEYEEYGENVVNDFCPQSWTASGYVILNLNNAVTVQPNESKDFYLLFFPYTPENLSQLMTKVGVRSNNKEIYTPTYKEAKGADLPLFAAGTRYWFKISETTNGLVWDDTDDVSSVIVPNPALSLALKEQLGEDKVTLTDKGYAVLSKAEADQVTILNFNEYSQKKNITSLNGIDVFSNLEELYCNEASLTGQLKIVNRNLKILEVADNDLTYVDVSYLSNLWKLNCSSNSKLKNSININGTDITDLKFDYTNCTWLSFISDELAAQIENFDCGNNAYKEMDLSKFTAVKNIWISYNQLSSAKLTLPQTSTVEILDITGNTNITSLDLSGYSNLHTLYNQGNNVVSLDLSNCPNLQWLYTDDNCMTSLDLTNNKKLTTIICGNQKNEQILTLKLPDELMEIWKADWEGDSLNGRVKLYEEELPGTSLPEFDVEKL